MVRKIGLIGIAALSLVMFTGCGEKAKTPTTTATTAPSKAEADKAISPGAFAADSTMAKLQQAQKIKIGVPFAQAPFGKANASGVPEGFDIEIAKLLAQGIFGGTASDAAKKITFVDTVSANRELFLKDGTVDLVVSTYGITDMRKLYADFAGPYFVAHGDVLVRSDNQTIRVASDLNNKNVCVKKDSVYINAARTQAPSATLIQKDTIAQCQAALEASEVDAFANDEVILAGLAQAAKTPMRLLAANLTTDNYGIGIRKGDVAFRTYLNERLKHVEDTGDWANAFAATIGKLDVKTPNPPAIDMPIPVATSAAIAPPTTKP